MDRLYSFVLPAYKARFFKEAIDSILAQTYINFELIIVNDASPEDLDSIIKLYDDPRIQYYVNKENIGGKDLVAQWNYSISYANGDYLILASDDDIYLPDFLERMDVLVQKYPDVNVFRPRVQYINQEGSLSDISGICDERINALEYAYRLFLEDIGSGIAFFVFNTEKLRSMGGFVNFPMAWCADEATVLMMAKDGICIDKHCLFYFRISGINISSINPYPIFKQKIKSQKMFYDYMHTFLNTIPINSEIDKKRIALLKTGIPKRFRSITAVSMNSASFIAAVRILPELLRLPWASPIFLIKRIIKKIVQLLQKNMSWVSNKK